MKCDGCWIAIGYWIIVLAGEGFKFTLLAGRIQTVSGAELWECWENIALQGKTDIFWC